MEQHTLVRWLKLLVIFGFAFGIAVCVLFLPLGGKEFVKNYPELSSYYIPWLFFLWILAAPCFAALGLAWKIFGNIEKERSFCMENAEALQKFSYLAAADSVILLVGNVLLLFLNRSHPAVFLASVLVIIVGIGIAAAAAVLSHLVRQAAGIQEENELTI